MAFGEINTGHKVDRNLEIDKIALLTADLLCNFLSELFSVALVSVPFRKQEVSVLAIELEIVWLKSDGSVEEFSRLGSGPAFRERNRLHDSIPVRTFCFQASSFDKM